MQIAESVKRSPLGVSVRRHPWRVPESGRADVLHAERDARVAVEDGVNQITLGQLGGVCIAKVVLTHDRLELLAREVILKMAPIESRH